MDILRFIGTYWHDILVVLILLVSFGFAIKKWWPNWQAMSSAEKVAYVSRLLQNLIPIALGLVTDAEAQYGGGTGKIKRAYVIDELYSRIPDEFKPYVTEQNLDAILTKALDEAKVLWEENTQIKALIKGEY
ncbi:hypothetical protein [Bacteroides sp.]|uniref:hypothetical protein n=1 Tax=Bacteroides sp. TaxID=29523 RepID=UPI002619F6CC|nr:hypothetical protein [Bacteroides sp.]MDD3041254.1 hypothetical protein [Bacteroides sp.]